MELSIVGCLFVLDNQTNDNKKKNDIKSLKIIINKNTGDLIRIPFIQDNSIKELLRTKINKIIGSSNFHLEQVYTLGEKKYYDDNKIDVIYMGLMNVDKIKKLDSDYELVDFAVIDNNKIILGDNIYSYRTVKKLIADSFEYKHTLNIGDNNVEKMILELLTSFKHLRSRMDNTDICFKLLPKTFTLEDVRIVYELIKGVEVDKSNFRKKIIKYCNKVDKIEGNKGYRPSQLYEFNPDSVEDWL